MTAPECNMCGWWHVCVSSFSRLIVFDSSWPHGPEHARPSYLPLPPVVVSKSCWLLRRHCPAISSSVIPFSSCRHTFLTSRSFPRSLLFSWDGQSIGASASGSVLPVSTQGWFPLEWIGLFSLQSRGLLRVSSSTTIQKHKFFGGQPSEWFTLCKGLFLPYVSTA